jgi:IMP dehydrogenase/GMP reductase
LAELYPMSFDKFREKFRRSKPKKPVIEEEDYVEYLPSSSKKTVYNPVEKIRQYKYKKQGYEQLEDSEEEPVSIVRSAKPKIIRVRQDGTVKRNAPPIPVTIVQDNRPRKIRIRADGRRRAPTPHKRSDSDSDDLIDLQSQSSSSSSSSSDGEDPFANWKKFK